jgi:hypothetical protein
VGWKLWCSEAAASEQASEPRIGPPSILLAIYCEEDKMHTPELHKRVRAIRMPFILRRLGFAPAASSGTRRFLSPSRSSSLRDYTLSVISGS